MYEKVCHESYFSVLSCKDSSSVISNQISTFFGNEIQN